jgi:hypothetical protein
MIVLSWSKATRDLLKSFGWGIRALHLLPAATMVPSPRRLPPYHLAGGGGFDLSVPRKRDAAPPLADPLPYGPHLGGTHPAHPRGKPGFLTHDDKVPRETDSPLEGGVPIGLPLLVPVARPGDARRNPLLNDAALELREYPASGTAPCRPGCSCRRPGDRGTGRPRRPSTRQERPRGILGVLTGGSP